MSATDADNVQQTKTPENPAPPSFQGAGRRLLHEYSGIPDGEIDSHVASIVSAVPLPQFQKQFFFHGRSGLSPR
jgi:hypothetical protein